VEYSVVISTNIIVIVVVHTMCEHRLLCLLCTRVLKQLDAEDISRNTICLYIGVYLVPWGGLMMFF
jgi:hypothetical protein